MTVFVASKQNKGFPCGSADKESACNVGVLSSIPGLGRFPGEGKGYPLQFSGLENSMYCIVHGVTKSRTQLSNFHVDFQHLKKSQLWYSLAILKLKFLHAVPWKVGGIWSSALLSCSKGGMLSLRSVGLVLSNICLRHEMRKAKQNRSSTSFYAVSVSVLPLRMAEVS